MTIDIFKLSDDSFFTIVTWIKRFLESLRLPNALRQLNTKIKSNQHSRSEEISYPTRADHELLYSTLQLLPQHGALQHTNLSISTLLFNHRTAITDDRTTNEEVAKLKEVFTPLLDANQSAIDIAFERLDRIAEPVRICL